MKRVKICSFYSANTSIDPVFETPLIQALKS